MTCVVDVLPLLSFLHFCWSTSLTGAERPALASFCTTANIDHECPTRSFTGTKNCSIKSFNNALKSTSADPKNTCFLDLSHGQLTEIQDGLFVNFTNLLALSLAYNNITNISPNAFLGPTRLQHLDLSMNPLRGWNTSQLHYHLPNLTLVDLTGTSPWKPDVALLRLKSLQEIRGIGWNRYCYNCSLIKSSNSTIIKRYNQSYTSYVEGYACRTNTYSPSSLLRVFATNGFVPTCIHDNQQCLKSEVSVTLEAPCRDKTLAVMALNFALGPLAITFNSMVIFITFYSKSLRQNVDMLLIANLAIGDFGIGLYSVTITSVHYLNSFKEMIPLAHNYCPYIGFLWVLGVGISVGFSLVLTLERYIIVVWYTKRNKKMNPRTLVIWGMVCWIWALLITLLPAAGIGNYALNTYCIPIFPVRSDPVQFYYSISVAGVAGLTYVTTIPLYIKLYVFVRRSSRNIHIRSRKDIKLAKRVFSLVFTNMIFFFGPVVISLIFSRVSRKTSSISRVVSEILNSALPLVCLTINSCCNPALYAFRRQLFRKELVELMTNLLHSLRIQNRKVCCRGKVNIYPSRGAYTVDHQLHQINSSVITVSGSNSSRS